MTALFSVLILTLAGGVRLWLAGGSFSVTSGFCVCVCPRVCRYLTGMVEKRTLEKYEREAKEKNRETW